MQGISSSVLDSYPQTYYLNANWIHQALTNMNEMLPGVLGAALGKWAATLTMKTFSKMKIQINNRRCIVNMNSSARLDYELDGMSHDFVANIPIGAFECKIVREVANSSRYLAYLDDQTMETLVVCRDYGQSYSPAFVHQHFPQILDLYPASSYRALCFLLFQVTKSIPDQMVWRIKDYLIPNLQFGEFTKENLQHVLEGSEYLASCADLKYTQSMNDEEESAGLVLLLS